MAAPADAALATLGWASAHHLQATERRNVNTPLQRAPANPYLNKIKCSYFSLFTSGQHTRSTIKMLLCTVEQ